MKLAMQAAIDRTLEDLKGSREARIILKQLILKAEEEATNPLIQILSAFALGIMYARGDITISPATKESSDAPRKES